MLDFLMISTRSNKRGVVEIYPKFIIKKSSTLMIRGGDFYAIWVEETGLWSTEEQDALALIDNMLDEYAKENRKNIESGIKVMHMWDAESGMIDCWHRYCQHQMRDNFHMLDEQIIFSNHVTIKKDYASKRLAYPLAKGDLNSYNSLIGTLYTEEERHKLEWAIGSIVHGDARILQKFMVLYGAAGTGKSTILDIIQQLFEGYYSVFDARAIGSSSNSFALESFRTNPLVAIQHDGDLSKIEDNTRLNSLVSHELMSVNEKFKSSYSNRFKCFLFMGTNKPVKITDARSGLIRRLIDVTPSGNKLCSRDYKLAVANVKFELGAIAYHCQEVYSNNPGYYDDYIPTSMLSASNDFYNYIEDSYMIFKKENKTTLKAAWEMYKVFCDDAKVAYPYSQRLFKEELKNYFLDYKERYVYEDGTRVRSYYSDFISDKFNVTTISEPVIEAHEPIISGINFTNGKSVFDSECKDFIAQYASDKGLPIKKWDEVTSKLSKLDTSKLHYVKLPENHIVIDFDIPDENGVKSLDLNLQEANKWPPTYAELSKSANGIHLHYIYSGDVSTLSRVYDDHIEIKVFTGKSSLRRQLTKCNNLPIATIGSGLPLRGVKSMVNFETIKNEKSLRTIIKRNLRKEIHPGTKPSIDFINKLLDDMYASGTVYDVTDLRNTILVFAAGSSNQAEYCISLVNHMKFQSEEPNTEIIDYTSDLLVFYDVEVFPNLFVVCWKAQGQGKPVIKMINPTAEEIEELIRLKLIGFNCRRYDNHILYARLLGYTNEQLYHLSKKIIAKSKNCFFGEAYNLSYTDVFDFSAKKQSLKKFEIELKIHHQELGLPWDEEVPEHKWGLVADYCGNDVIATEATFDYRIGDFRARQILADIAGMTVNDTTNTLTTKIIFGSNRKPQSSFNYRNMGDIPDDVSGITVTKKGVLFDNFGDRYTVFNNSGAPVFPGYTYEFGKSTYRGETVGEGGYVHGEPGMYYDVALLDVESMHPRSAVNEQIFGPEYTQRFEDILNIRLSIKHGDFNMARNMWNGLLAKYLADETMALDLSYALKIAINSVYGLTSASFENPFRDPRNVDNIAAKRGALFMINLKHEVQARGFIVAHVKTDSIKIPNATPEIIQFVNEYGEQYGYKFEHEATYSRLCLVNNAVYIAKYKTGKKAGQWTATGTQFSVPYVFKKLFSKEEIGFDDLCETKSVTSALYLDMNEGLPDVSILEKNLERSLKKKEWVNQEVYASIAEGHNYHFIGKVGEFCPMSKGGGIMLRETVSKTGEKGYAAATGTKGYRWMESEMVKSLGLQNDIDRSYYDDMVTSAIKDIEQYGDFEWFTSETPNDVVVFERDARDIIPVK